MYVYFKTLNVIFIQIYIVHQKQCKKYTKFFLFYDKFSVIQNYIIQNRNIHICDVCICTHQYAYIHTHTRSEGCNKFCIRKFQGFAL